jgi:hypothetical protein
VTRAGGLAALVLGAMLFASDASAWTPIGGSRPTWSEPAPYGLTMPGSSDLGGFDATLAIVREGMDDWGRVSCSSLQTEYTGPSSGRAFGGGSNVITWYESGWIDSSSAIGITGPSWDGTNTIRSAEMAMNGVHFTWITGSGSGGSVNAYSITLHEGGHYYGLGHSADSSATMYYAYTGGIDSLGSDDQTGICTLYPGGGGGPTDPGTPPPPTDPMDPPPGAGEICATCRSDADCPGLCLRYPSGMFCGADCTSDADCGGDRCERVSDGSMQCVRRNAEGAADCSAPPPSDPDPPPPDPSDPADPMEPTDPAPGEPGPDPGEPDPGDPGTPPPGGPTRDLGDPCTTNAECRTGLCAVDVDTDGTFCTQLCGPGAACPSGFACEEAGGGVSACRPDSGALGAECSAPGDCLSSLCAELSDGRRFCTDSCNETTAPCPDSFLCVATADGAAEICLPHQRNGATPNGLVGSCSLGRSRDGAPLALVLLGLVLLLFRRRGPRRIRRGH